MQTVALRSITPAILEDVRINKGTREIEGSGCIIAPKEWEDMLENYCDLQLGLEALRRERENPNEEGYTQAEVMKMLGISPEDLQPVAGDVEIE